MSQYRSLHSSADYKRPDLTNFPNLFRLGPSFDLDSTTLLISHNVTPWTDSEHAKLCQKHRNRQLWHSFAQAQQT
jgi:hypothetical protein